ncbi:MAG: PKD domain-containing protein [Flavobacteriaceae bacterium]|nr:PKD domain-containing protein [Flavobacteriaceae bacterium]
MNYVFSALLLVSTFIFIGCDEDDEEGVSPVEAFFSSSTANAEIGQEIQFTSLKNENVVSWEWTFEGGTPASSTEQNPTVTYSQWGVYGVTLIVKSDDSEDILEVGNHITIGEVVFADFSADNTTINAGESVNYTSTPNANVTSFAWTFEGGTPATSTDQNPPSVVYDTAGVYTTTLVATGASGESITIEKTEYITVNPILFVDATFQADTATSIDETETVTFSIVDDTNVDTYLWTFPGGTPGTSSDPNPTITYNTPGLHDVTLQVNSSNDSDVVTETDFVDVTDIFFVDATFTADITSVVVGNTVTFTVTDATDIANYNWSFPGGTPATSNAASPTITYNTVGTYDASLTASSSNDVDTATNTNYITVTAGGGPTTVLDESFETDGNGTRYTASAEFSDGFGDFFGRTNLNTTADDAGDQPVGTLYSLNGLDGSFCYAGMDLDGDGQAATQTLLFDDLNIAGLTGLELNIMVAEDDDGATNQDWDANTLLFVEVDIDNSGSFTKVLQWASQGATNTEPGLDTDFDGIADSTPLTDTFQNFMANIAGTGLTIDIRITFERQDAGDEDAAIDKIVLTGN